MEHRLSLGGATGWERELVAVPAVSALKLRASKGRLARPDFDDQFETSPSSRGGVVKQVATAS